MLTYRLEKGAPLTLEEMDGNFRELEERLRNLSTQLEERESVGRLFLEGHTLRVMGSHGTDLGDVHLPSFSLQSKGEWKSGVSYVPSDFVTHQGALYACLHPHVSRVWDEEGLWKEIFRFSQNTSSLPLYEAATLPSEENVGTLALLMGDQGARVIFFNGEGWEALPQGEKL